MKNSLQKLMVLTMTTTMLSGFGAYAQDKRTEDPLLPNNPGGTQVPVVAPGLPPKTDVSCCISSREWFRRKLSKKNIQAAADGLTKVANGLSAVSRVVLPIVEVLDQNDAETIEEVEAGIKGGTAAVNALDEAAHATNRDGLINALAKAGQDVAQAVADASNGKMHDDATHAVEILGQAGNVAKNTANDLSGGVTPTSVFHALINATEGTAGIVAANSSGKTSTVAGEVAAETAVAGHAVEIAAQKLNGGVTPTNVVGAASTLALAGAKIAVDTTTGQTQQNAEKAETIIAALTPIVEKIVEAKSAVDDVVTPVQPL